MRKLSFLFLCIMLGVGMMASPAAGADVIGLGINEIHFYNYETLFTPVEWDTQGNVTKYEEVDFTGPVVPTIDPGDILLGIIGVQDVIIKSSLYWTFSATDQLSGVFAQKVAEVIPPDNGVPGGNQYDIINDWDNQPRIIFEAANTTATFETLTNETFTLGLAGNEVIALYHDTGPGATPLETNGSIFDDIAKATDGSPWATFGYNVGSEAGMTDNQPAGDQDDTGYYYSYTSVFGTPVNNFVGESWAGLDAIQNNTGYPLNRDLNDPGEGEMDVVIAGLLNDMFLSSEFEMYPLWASGGSPWVFQSNDPAWLHVVEEEVPGQCRMTGGSVTDNWEYIEGTYAKVQKNLPKGVKKYTTGGQVGAPKANDPSYGEWTHTQHSASEGSFTFHAGTSSAPEGTEISSIACGDEGWCVQARCAPFKQIYFDGIGSFKNVKGFNDDTSVITPGETLHYFRAHVGDFGEPGKNNKQQSEAECDWVSGGVDIADIVLIDAVPVGDKGGQECDECPDWYEIEIHCTTDSDSPVIYTVGDFIDGGNFQIHPEVGQQCPY